MVIEMRFVKIDEEGDILWFWQYIRLCMIWWSWWNTFGTHINDALDNYEDDNDDEDDDEEEKDDDDDDEN